MDDTKKQLKDIVWQFNYIFFFANQLLHHRKFIMFYINIYSWLFLMMMVIITLFYADILVISWEKLKCSFRKIYKLG